MVIFLTTPDMATAVKYLAIILLVMVICAPILFKLFSKSRFFERLMVRERVITNPPITLLSSFFQLPAKFRPFASLVPVLLFQYIHPGITFFIFWRTYDSRYGELVCTAVIFGRAHLMFY